MASQKHIQQWRSQKWTNGGLNNRGQIFFLLVVHITLIDFARRTQYTNSKIDIDFKMLKDT
jgi:hypothetical protein